MHFYLEKFVGSLTCIGLYGTFVPSTMLECVKTIEHNSEDLQVEARGFQPRRTFHIDVINTKSVNGGPVWVRYDINNSLRHHLH